MADMLRTLAESLQVYHRPSPQASREAPLPKIPMELDGTLAARQDRQTQLVIRISEPYLGPPCHRHVRHSGDGMLFVVDAESHETEHRYHLMH